jgi:PAS domain S-box-containing protein
MLDLSEKKILISSCFLALLCAASIVTNLTPFKSLAFAGCGFSLGVFFVYYLLQRQFTQRLEALLQKNAEHFSSIENKTEPICQFLPDGTLTFVNEACCNHFGKSREQLVGNKYIIPLISKAIAAQGKTLPMLGIVYDNESPVLQSYGFFNLSSNLLVIGNFDGYYTDLNVTWERILGYTAQELKAQPFLEFVHPEDRESTQAELDKLINGLPVIEFDNRYFCKDGSYKRLSWTAQPFVKEGLFYGVARDISSAYEPYLRQWHQESQVLVENTHDIAARLDKKLRYLYLNSAWVSPDINERQQAEAVLRERAQQLTEIIANIPSAVYRCLLHASGEISLLYISEGIKELVGINAQEALTQTERLLELIHPEDRTHFYLNKRTFQQSLQPFSLKYRIITHSGKIKLIRDSSRYFISGNNGDVIVDGVLLDISDAYDELYLRKQAESALQENQRFLQQIADTTLTMIYIFDLHEQCNVYLNRFGEEFFGKTSQEIKARGVEFFKEILLPEQLAQIDALKQKLISTKEGEIIENELCMKNAGGEWRWFHVWEVVFTRNNEGKAQQILGTAIDITEQKRSQEICYALETEKELRKLQFRFFSMASHEFRTPLSTILVTTQLLVNSEQELPMEKRQRNLKRIEITAKHMTQLLNDILTFNRAETGELELEPTLIALHRFCSHLIEEMQLNSGSQYVLKFSTKGKIKAVYLDEKLLYSILTNLLSNAVKYSPKGGEVDLTLIYQENEIIFHIQDYGIGIPLEYQQQLFEPFYRGSNIGNIAGTGLGLAIVKKYLDLQGGKISLDSQVGKGTLAIVSIPLIDC